MNPRRLFVSTLVSLVCAVLASAPARGQEDTPPAPATTAAQDPALDKAAVQQRITDIEADESVDEDTKQTVLQNLQSALADLEKAEQYQERTAAARQSIAEDPATAEGIRTELGQATEATAEPIPENLTAAEASNERDKEQSSLSAAKDALESQDAALQTLRDRPTTAREEQTATTEELAQTRSDLEVQPAEGTADLVVETRRIRLLAKEHALSRQLQTLEQELLAQPMQLALAEARREQMQRQVTQHEATVAALEGALDKIRTEEAEAVRQRAEQEQEAVADQNPVVQRAAQTNTTLSEQLAEAVADRQPATDAKNRYEGQLEQTREMHARIRDQLEGRGLRGLSGSVLRRQRQQADQILVDVQASRTRWRGRSSETEGRKLELYLTQRELTNLGTATELALADADPPLEGDERDTAAGEITKLLETRRGLAEQLDGVYFDLLKDLQALEDNQSGLISEVTAFASLLDEWLLWMPSTTGPSGELTNQIAYGVEWLVSPARWQRAGETVLATLRDRWPLTVLAAIALALLLMMRRRARARLEAISAKIRRVSTDRIGLTWQALGLLALLVVPLPFVFAYVALALLSTDATRALGEGLLDATILAFAFSFLSLLCAPGGVGNLHFKWRSSTTVPLRRNFRWALWPLVVTMFLVSATEAQPNEDVRNGLGRAAFVVSCLALLVFWQQVLRPGGEIMQPILARRPQSWLARLKWVWYPGALAVPLALAMLAVLGYYYTALELDECLLGTITLVVGVALVRAIAVRWLLIEQRRMAVEQFQAQRAASANTETVAGEEGEIPVPDESEVDLSAVNEQTRKLVGTASVLTVILGVWAIWLDVLPALRVLEGVHLWMHTTTLPDGTEVPDPITLQDIILAALAVFLTVTATRNIPGLMQVVVLKNLPLEPSTRYAIVSVSRYVLTIVGVVVVFQMLGFSWSSVQWLVAALGVGIGFGLQEIIANFICGLILLFERPVRIGDSVTIGDTSGTVSRIRIRATTIMDWDRKEMLIPNKELITGRVLNWTLSSKLNRVTILVGVAYGTDTEPVRQLLMKVASEHPKVVDEPAPLATFEGFGDSTLNFVLRAYLPDYEGRLSVISELHTAVDEAFKAAGIEIAFPQLDLHVRSAEKPVVIQGPPPSSPTPKRRETPVEGVTTDPN